MTRVLIKKKLINTIDWIQKKRYSLADRLPWQRRGWGIDSMRNCRTEIARSITVAVIKKNYEVWILNVYF